MNINTKIPREFGEQNEWNVTKTTMIRMPVWINHKFLIEIQIKMNVILTVSNQIIWRLELFRKKKKP